MTRGWIARLEPALALLAERLDTPPSLEELAAAAAVSPCHFHRVWRALTGETVRGTVARLRVAVAQARLIAPDATVTDVAMDGGFGTPQSFARAFRRVAGTSPSEFLRAGRGEAGVAPPPHATVQIEFRPATRLLAVRQDGGPYRELHALFWQVWTWAEANGRLAGLEGIYGIPHDDPVSVDEEALRYDAGLALADPEGAPAPLRVVTLPAGRYATQRHTGPYDGLEATSQTLVARTLAEGHTLGEVPLLHHFLDDPDEVDAARLRTDAMLLLAST